MSYRRVLLSALAVATVLISVLAVLRHQRYVNLAATALDEARRFGSPSTNYENARDWLHGSGFHVATTGGDNFVSGLTTEANTDHLKKFTIVEGYKRLGGGALGLGHRWMCVTFFFTEDGVFLRVGLDANSEPPPWWSVPTRIKIRIAGLDKRERCGMIPLPVEQATRPGKREKRRRAGDG